MVKTKGGKTLRVLSVHYPVIREDGGHRVGLLDAHYYLLRTATQLDATGRLSRHLGPKIPSHHQAPHGPRPANMNGLFSLSSGHRLLIWACSDDSEQVPADAAPVSM